MAKSKPKTKMPVSERAKQFVPFQAVKGLEEALAAKEKIRVPRRQLSEDMIEEINKKLTEISRGQIITVVYYCNEEYVQLTGMAAKVDPYLRTLQIVTTGILFEDIYEIII